MTEALEVLAPVLFAAVIVFGILGAITLKRVAPLIAARGSSEPRFIDGEGRDRLSSGDVEQLKRDIAVLSRRIEELEQPARRVGQLEEDVRFLTRLLEERTDSRAT
jgi:hypothetical protein